jgi:hypothetical protein
LERADAGVRLRNPAIPANQSQPRFLTRE